MDVRSDYSHRRRNVLYKNVIYMFNLFKKKSPVEKLQAEYEKLMKEGFDLSKSDRTASDQKYAQANDIMAKIDALQKS